MAQVFARQDGRGPELAAEDADPSPQRQRVLTDVSSGLRRMMERGSQIVRGGANVGVAAVATAAQIVSPSRRRGVAFMSRRSRPRCEEG